MFMQDAETQLEPAARRVLGTAADVWLAPFWLELARAMAGLLFDPHAESLHAAPFFMRGGDWQAAAAGIEAIPSWRRQPAPLSWMIETRFHADGLDAVWPLIAELAWMAPQRARLLSSLLSDPQLARRVRRFDTEFDDSDAQEGFAWFPAWLLIRRRQPHHNTETRRTRQRRGRRTLRAPRHDAACPRTPGAPCRNRRKPASAA